MDSVNVPLESLKALYDLVVHSMDYGSGFLDQTDIDVLREVAPLIGVCPNNGTHTDMLEKYPECSGIVKTENPYWHQNYPSRKKFYLSHKDH